MARAPLSPFVTVFLYDTAGNLTEKTHPDSTTESWTYNSLNYPTAYGDRLGNLTVYTYDSAGNRTSQRRVFGEIDDEINQETDDLVTTMTYTPGGSGQPPKGLLATLTDPLGRVTTYAYSTRGLVTSITYADGTSIEASVQYVYNSTTDLLTQSIDELGRTTDYTYDNLGRLTLTTLPDPDASGPLSRPTIAQTWNGNGRMNSQTDPLGRVTSYTYAHHGRVTSVTRPDHDGDTELTVTEYDFDAAHRPTTTTDPLGRVTTTNFSTLGWVTSTVLPDPDGSGSLTAPTTTYTYDNIGRVLTETNPLGKVTTYEYDNFGREVTITLPDPDGTGGPLASPVLFREYDAEGNLILQRDPLGAETTYVYDAAQRLVTVNAPDPDESGELEAPVTAYEYDKAGNLVSTTDPLDNVTEYTYDARNRRTHEILPDPDGGGSLISPTTVYAYNAASEVTSITDPLSRVTSFTYDGLGRQLTATAPDPDSGGPLASPVTTFAYDAAGRLTSTTDPLGNVTTYGYDLLDHQTTITGADPDGAGGSQTSPVTTSTYDASGQLLSMTDPLSRLTSYEYDNLGRTTKVTAPDPDGAGSLVRPFTTYTYDAGSNLKTVTDPLNHTTTHDYDHLQRRTKITDALTGQTQFTYDAAGRMLSLKDPVNNTTAWQYDLLGRVTQETNHLNKTRTFKYDTASNLTERIDRLGRKIEYVYDNLYRNTAEKWYDGTTLVRTLSFTYDAASQLTAASDPAASLAYTYDQLGRVTAEAQTIAGLTPVITYQSQYDAASRRTQLLALIGGTADFKNVFTYDNLSRLTVVKQQGTAGGHAVAEKRADLAYDAASAFKTIDRYADLAGFEHVVSTHYSYDGMGRISKLLHTEGPTAPGSGWGTDALAGYEYAYDAASRFTSINSFADGLTNYTHDNTDQLTGADHTGQIDETYTYDANGNRTMTGYSTGSNNQLTTDGTNNYTYDDEGNRLTKTRISNGEKEEYTWDHRNRLTKVTFRNASGTVVKTVDQSYDVFNQWIRRTVDPDGTTGSAALQDTFFSHEGGEINLDFDGSTTGDLTHRYLFNPAAVDQLLADETVTSLLTAGTTLWTLADHLGTLRDLATYNASTDDTAVANHRRFDSFGRLISETNSAIDTIFAFTSRPFDESTGLQNNLNRWYDVQLGQWLSEDPLSYHDGYNLRRYVSNAAVSSIDPFGLIAHVPLIIQKAWEVGQVIETAAGYLPPLPSQELTCGVGGTFGIGSSFILSRDDGFRAFLESEYWHPTYNVHVKPTHVLVKVTIKLMECDAVFNDDIITITSQEIFSVSSALSSPMISYDVTVDFQYVCTADGLKISTKDGSSTGLALDPFQNTVELCYGVLWEVAPVWDSTADPRAQEVQKSFFVNPDVYVFPQRLRKLERTRDLFSVKCCCSA